MVKLEIGAILEVFRDDPDTTIAMLSDRQTLALLEALLADVPKDTNWLHLIRMANGLPSQTSNEMFVRIIRAANNELRRRELLQALVNYGHVDDGTGDDDDAEIDDANGDISLNRFEAAIVRGTFDELIVHMGQTAIENFAKGRLAHPVVTAYCAGRIQRFLEAGDPKRAFDELVASATIIDGWRPPLFEKWIERVWQLHRDKNLVIDLTEDPKDWRNNAWDKTMRFGQNRTGFKTTKPKKPTVNLKEEAVPLGKLWERYKRLPTDAEKRIDWGERVGWRGEMYRNDCPIMVRKPGNMIRDMAWYWHNEAKERKLREFCILRSIPYTDPI